MAAKEIKMKKKNLKLFIVLLLMTVVATPTFAGDFQDASGEYCFTQLPEDVRFAGPNLIEHVSGINEFSGTLTGTGTEYGRVMLFDFPEGFWLGKINIHLEDATVDDANGELFILLKVSTPNGFVGMGGTWLITGGTGGLKGLRGGGSWSGPGVNDFGQETCANYGGSIHFEP